MITRAEIERGRRRLWAQVFVLLTAFAGLSVALSLLGPSVLTFLLNTPIAARIGMLALTVGFVALVWERETSLGKLEHSLARQEALTTSFQNRVKAVEALLDAAHRLNSPVALDDVLSVVLVSAIDLIDADGGVIEVFDHEESGIAVTHRHSIPEDSDFPDRRVQIKVPLKQQEVQVGALTLVLPEGRAGFDEPTLDALTRFGEQAAHAVARARIHSEQQASVSHLQAVNLIKSRFLGTVSHELRTPLTSVVGYSATLDRHWDRFDDEGKRQFVRSVRKQGERLCRVVERVLEAARVEMDSVTISPVLHDVRESMSDALNDFRLSGAGRIETEWPDRRVEAEADPSIIGQIVSNLVDNALRYSEGPVKVGLTESDDTFKISVVDQGPGIDERRLKNALDPLHRTEGDFGSGAGLGFHIVQTLVRDHGGHLDIISSGSGTQVIVELPRGARQDADQTLGWM